MAARAHNPMHWPYHVASGLNVDKVKVFEGPDAREQALEYAQSEADSTGWSAYVHRGTPGSMVVGKAKKIKPTSTSNPAVSPEQYRLAQAVLSGTARTGHMSVEAAREIVDRTPARLRSEYSRYTNPGVAMTREIAWAAATDAGNRNMRKGGRTKWNEDDYNIAADTFSRLWSSRNPFYGTDLDLETHMAPQWKYYDSKKARDMDARLKEGEGKKVVKGYSIFGFSEGGGKKYRMRLADHRGNPREASDDMYASFHGEPSDETIEFQTEEHYHSHLPAMGELIELKVKLVNGGMVTIGFEDSGEEKTGNPFWPFNSFTKTTIYHVGTGEKYTAAGTYKGYTLYQKKDTGEFLVPALDKDSRFDTAKDVKRFVDSWTKHRKNPGGPLDEHAAKELELYVENDADLYRQQYTPINKNLITKMARGVYNHAGAVKLFGYLMESGAKKYAKEYSEGKDWHQIFSPATRKHVAEIYARHFETEAELGNYDRLLPKKYADWRKKNPKRRVTGPFHEAGQLLDKIKRGATRPLDDFTGTVGKVGGYLDTELGRALNPHDTGPTYLTSNEKGTQLFATGGDQSLDLPGLGITGAQAEKEFVKIGAVKLIVYHTHKVFDGKREEYDYEHKLSEESNGPLPDLMYDRINRSLKFVGGMYTIPRPLVGTSPGIVD